MTLDFFSKQISEFGSRSMPWRTCRAFKGPDDANGYGFYLRLYWTRKRGSNVTCRDSGCSDVKELKHTCGNDPRKFLATGTKAQSGRGQVRLKTQRSRTTAPVAHVGAKKTIGLAGCSNSQGKLRTSSGNFTRSSRWWPWVRFRGVQFTCGTKFDCRVPSCCKTHVGRL